MTGKKKKRWHELIFICIFLIGGQTGHTFMIGGQTGAHVRRFHTNNLKTQPVGSLIYRKSRTRNQATRAHTFVDSMHSYLITHKWEVWLIRGITC